MYQFSNFYLLDEAFRIQTAHHQVHERPRPASKNYYIIFLSTLRKEHIIKCLMYIFNLTSHLQNKISEIWH